VTAEDTGRNIWLDLLDHAIAGRERSEIAMQGIWALSAKAVMVLGLGCSAMTFGVGLLLVGFGYATAIGPSSECRELDGLSRRYPTMILPIA
jgi:hypothetical protein